MARPALSASRATDVLDLFSAFPGRAFTMSEVIRATGVNVASCHAVLAALEKRGYLERRGREYRLGRALIAVGAAAERMHPLVPRAQRAAASLHASLGHAVLLSTVAGEDILALTSIEDAAGRSARLKTGQRIRMVPPNGLHFIAWSNDEDIEEWLSRSHDNDEKQRGDLLQSIALTRQRGYQVTLRSEETPAFAQLMSQLAENRPPLDYRNEGGRAADHGWTLEQPGEIDDDLFYNVALIAAPIFDQEGRAALSLALGGFAEPLPGTRIHELAKHLLGACLHVMREDRGG